MSLKRLGHDFLPRYLFFGLGLSFFFWLFLYGVKGGVLSSLFFSSINLFFHYHLFVSGETLTPIFGKEKLYFYELFLGQFLSLCFVTFESGVPILAVSLLFLSWGLLLVEEGLHYFPSSINQEWEDSEEKDDREKLFFHDVINKTTE